MLKDPQEVTKFIHQLYKDGFENTRWYEWLITHVQCGPFDGGCLLLASALATKWDGEIHVLKALWGSELMALHAYVYLPKYHIWIDAYGCYKNPEEAYNTFQQHEKLKLQQPRMAKYDPSIDLHDAQTLLCHKDEFIYMLTHDENCFSQENLLTPF